MPAEQEPPSHEGLAGLVASLRRELAGALTALGQAKAELAQARERIAELEARLKQNPRNSSRLPSSEGLAMPPPRSLAHTPNAGSSDQPVPDPGTTIRAGTRAATPSPSKPTSKKTLTTT